MEPVSLLIGAGLVLAGVLIERFIPARKRAHHKPCPCQQYVGPRVLDPGYTARELA